MTAPRWQRFLARLAFDLLAMAIGTTSAVLVVLVFPLWVSIAGAVAVLVALAWGGSR